MLKVKYRQYTKFGCGSFTLANIFDDHRFVLDIPAAQGERVADLNRKMNKYHRALVIVPMFFTSPFLKSANRLRDPAIFGYEGEIPDEYRETMARPLLLTFAKHNKELHTVALIHNLRNGFYYLVDSGTENVYVASIEDILKGYNVVQLSQFSIWACEDRANFLMLPKEQLRHIIPEGE